jgi:hypothetical protein
LFEVACRGGPIPGQKVEQNLMPCDSGSFPRVRRIPGEKLAQFFVSVPRRRVVVAVQELSIRLQRERIIRRAFRGPLELFKSLRSIAACLQPPSIQGKILAEYTRRSRTNKDADPQ